jgi:hypothetical protein
MGSPLGRRATTRLPSASTSREVLVGLSYQIGKWQAAAFATIMPLQLDEILATLIFSGSSNGTPSCRWCWQSPA